MQTGKALALCGLVLLNLWLCIQSVPIAKDNTLATPSGENLENHFDSGLHYNHYLKEVVDYLEKDPHFQMKLTNMSIEDIKQGKIAKELDFVGHNVRYQLDELKRHEMNRLRTLIKTKHDILQGGDAKAINHQALLKQFEHLDHENPHTFEIKDLDRLIKTTNKDLENFDEQHHKEFKMYEMMKEHERREHLKVMDEEHRKKEEAHYEEMKKKHAEHPKINHPGSEDQLKEVWRETDGLDEEAFNPKTFFKLHDSNDDGYLDEQELEALFNQELQKMYNPNNEEDDMYEMEEERLRMREHVMKEMDTDRDRLVSLDEFLVGAKQNDDKDWTTLEQTPLYTEEELKEFEESLAKEHSELAVKTDELQKKKQELEKHQEELNAQMLQLQQAVEHLDKLKTEKHTPAEGTEALLPGYQQQGNPTPVQS